MRHITGVPHDEICNHASALVSESAEPLTAALRTSTENSSQELALIVDTAQVFRRELAAELSRCPKNNVWAGMFGVDDWYEPSLKQLGKKRALTYELSNFGMVKIVESLGASEHAHLRLEKMLVSQYVFLRTLVFLSLRLLESAS